MGRVDNHTKIMYAMLQHLVLSCEHLRFSLVKSALVTSAQSPVAAFSANRRRSKPRRCSTAWCSRAAMEVGAGHIERRAMVENRRAWVGSNRGRWNRAVRSSRCWAIGDGTTIFSSLPVAIVWVVGLESLQFELLLADHLQQPILEREKSVRPKLMGNCA